MFKREKSFTERLFESQKLYQKFPNHCPVICEKFSPEYDPDTTLVKTKYLVKLDIPFRRFIYQVRKQLTLSKHTALFFFINNIMPPINSLFSTLYEYHKENDGFLYITYTTENVFG